MNNVLNIMLINYIILALKCYILNVLALSLLPEPEPFTISDGKKTLE